MVVVVLSDASLATSNQPFPPPRVRSGMACAADRSERNPRRRPGLRLGRHDRASSSASFRGSRTACTRSRGLRTIARVTWLRSGDQRARHAHAEPEARGTPEIAQAAESVRRSRRRSPGGRLGQHTRGAIEEAVEHVRGEGHKVSSLHLRSSSRWRQASRRSCSASRVITIEGNWCDRPEDALIDENNRRYSALAMLLRARFLIDVDCWSEVRGQPITPRVMREVILQKLAATKEAA